MENAFDAAPAGHQINERGLARQGFDLQLTVRRERLAGHVLHDRDGAQPDERDGNRVGAHAVASRAGCGLGGAEASWIGQFGRSWPP